MLDYKIQGRKNRKALVGEEVQFTYKLDRNQSNWLVSFRFCYKKVKDLFYVVRYSVAVLLLCMMKDSLRI